MGAGKLNSTHLCFMQNAVVVILITLLCGCSSVSGLFGGKNYLWMNNKLYPGTDMYLHCKSKDDDLGEHRVSYDMNFSWSFPDDFFGRTRFDCQIWWWNSEGKKVEGDLNVYNPKRDTSECGHECSRFVKPDGVYFNVNGKFELKFPWPKPN